MSKFRDEISGCENGTGRGSEEGINMVCSIVRGTGYDVDCWCTSKSLGNRYLLAYSLGTFVFSVLITNTEKAVPI